MNPLQPLIEQLKKFPGIGEKSAQRLAFFVLSLSQHEANTMADTISKTKQSIRFCDDCHNISTQPKCHICIDPKRDTTTLCIVAEPKDIFAIERTLAFKGHYHVLGGLISPLDGIQPESLRIKELQHRIKNQHYSEIIFGINATVEGDTTIMYLQSLLDTYNVKTSTLAYGLPIGSDLDYADEMTLTKAISARRQSNVQ